MLVFSSVALASPQSGIIAQNSIIFSQGEPATFIKIDNKTIPLLLDTGAAKASLVLSHYALKNIPVTYTGETHCMETITGRKCMKKFIIPAVSIGRLILRNVSGEEMQALWGNQKGFIPTEASRNGVIGLSFLKQFNVLIDYPNHQITYMTHQTSPALNLKKCHSVKTNFDRGLMAEFVFHHKKNQMVLDTGSNLSIIKSGDTNKLLPCDEDHANDIKNCKIEKLSLFPDQAPEIFYVQNLKLPFDGIIGSAYLKNHKIFIDSYNQAVFYC